MIIVEESVVITNQVGLHARPARLLVQAAAQFSSQIQVKCKDKTANAKSMIGILTLGAMLGDTLHLRAEGDDAQNAVNTLTELVRRKFGEE